MPQGDEQLVMPDTFARHLAGGDPFHAVMNLDGEVVRQATGRRTIRFALNGHHFYAKLHTGVGWREVLKNALRLRRPVVSAADEWRAIERVRRLGLSTTRPVAFGCRGRNPARIESFLITEDLGQTLTLEVLGQRLHDRNVRRRIINQVASIARTLHASGMNHRDMYLCHFRIAVNEAGEPVGDELHLMDLHRAQIRTRVPQRWRVKDVAGLYFSAMDAGLTRREALRFMRSYGGDLRQTLRRDRWFWWRVYTRAVMLYRSLHRRAPHPPLRPAKGWWRR